MDAHDTIQLPPNGIERRRDDRHRTMYQVAHVVTDTGEHHLCLIRDISAGGLMLETFEPFACQAHLRIESKGCESVEGKVAWCTERRVGVVFDRRIDVEEYLHHRPGAGAGIPRAPRIAVCCPAQLRWDSQWHGVEVLDVSQCGAKLRSELPLEPGEDVTLHLHGLPSRTGVVRWHGEDRLGMQFTTAIPLPHLAGWACAAAGRMAA